MNEKINNYQAGLSRCITFLLKPLVRILLRSGIGFSDFAEWAKQVYVDVAEKEFTMDGRSQSTSRISILTGLHRKEVARIRKALETGSATEKNTPANRAERVINAWLRDAAYTSDKKSPIDLPFSSPKEGEPSFESLVKSYSGDIHSRTLLDELIRIGAVELLPNDQLRLVRSGYIPDSHSLEQLDIAGQSAYDLLGTLDNNIDSETDEKFFQRSVAYRHLSKQTVEEFKKYSEQENEKLLLKLNKWLAERDLSETDSKQSTDQYRAGVGVYFFEEPSSETNRM